MSAARRIVSEWSDYDEEMQRLAQQIAKDKAAAAAAHQQQLPGSSLNKDELWSEREREPRHVSVIKHVTYH